jgi:hypothetical protein
MEKADGTLIEARDNPEASFDGQALNIGPTGVTTSLVKESILVAIDFTDIKLA